ncbi:MAG: sigma-70 family RNA polymerase sigma factor [Tannerellaceae bacterium]|jgi:RNA polymerase sigma-70 factor (ECF subfamily)|nr:sigma-70 family RNA polymerase sigma factor [Tannerellaceae bacterium]
MTAACFKERFMPLHPRLYRLAFSFMEDSGDAEDVLQEAYLKLWARRGELMAVENAEAFCVTMVRNLCLDRLRNARSGRGERSGNHDDDMSVTSPEDEAIRRDELRLVERLIERLPDNQRRVLRLYGVKEYSLKEIEEITGLSSVNVRVLLSRARRIIKEQFYRINRL